MTTIWKCFDQNRPKHLEIWLLVLVLCQQAAVIFKTVTTSIGHFRHVAKLLYGNVRVESGHMFIRPGSIWHSSRQRSPDSENRRWVPLFKTFRFQCWSGVFHMADGRDSFGHHAWVSVRFTHNIQALITFHSKTSNVKSNMPITVCRTFKCQCHFNPTYSFPLRQVAACDVVWMSRVVRVFPPGFT